MEQVSFKNSRGLKLVGDLYRAPTDNIIIMAHGFMNDRSSQGRFEQVAERLNEEKYNVLKFDFSGCGESDQDIIELDKEIDDLKSAIDFAKEEGFKKIALFGNSLGGLVCLKAYNPEISSMVLTGPITDSMNYDWEKFYSEEKMQELKNKGYLTMGNEKTGYRKISKEMLDAFSQIDQKELLKGVNCPILIIHGDRGEEEKELLERSKKALKILPNSSKLKVVEGAAHGIRDKYHIVVELTVDWFLNNFKIR
jgi:pimeloyl-ACP methyl ester carboxylesterase